MRPEVLKQQPHHFIRRWPKERRDKRVPSHRFISINILLTRGELEEKVKAHGLGGLPDTAIVTFLLDQVVGRICPKNWVLGGPHGRTVAETDFNGTLTVNKEVGFYRKAM